jgi:hypothetical protein
VRTSFFKRLVAVGGAFAVTFSGAVLLTASPASARTVVTDYGLQSNAFGTRVISNNVSLNAGRTAVAWISCTRLAGLNPSNHANAANYLAEAGTPKNNPWIKMGAVTSTNRTYRQKTKGIVGVTAVNKIASLTMTGPAPAEGVPGPELVLEGLTTRATAYAEHGVLKAGTGLSSTRIDLTLPESTPIDDALADLLGAVSNGIGAVTTTLKQNGGAIAVPGLGELRLGHEVKREFTNYAAAEAYALVVVLAGQDGALDTPDDSEIQIGRSRARISKNLPAGVMNGYGYALDLKAADDLLSIGRFGLQVLPCRGTQGEIHGLQVPAQDVLDGALDLGAMAGFAYGLQSNDGSGTAWTKGKVSEVALGSGDQRVVVKGIVGVAEVRKKASGKIVRSIKGTSVGSLTIGGEEQSIPTDGTPMELPGLGMIEFNLKEVSRRGVSVTAVRITLNPGEASQTVINLGNARTMIKKA